MSEIRFVADLDANDKRRCYVETTVDNVTIVHYIDGVTTVVDFERVFNAQSDVHDMRAGRR